MRILLATHRLPYAPNRGDRTRAYHLIKLLASRHELHLVSLVHDQDERAQIDGLTSMVASVRGARVPVWRNRVRAMSSLAGARPLTHTLLASPEMESAIRATVDAAPPDLVIAYCTGVADILFRPPLQQVPAILDMVDVDSEKWSEMADRHRPPMRWIYQRELRTMRAFERTVMRRAAFITVVSERERELAERCGLGDRALTVPNGVAIDSWTPPSGIVPRQEVVFCGVFNYEPNEEGAIWLASAVWPLVKKEFPGAKLKLVGMHPSARIRALAAPGSIVVTGAVPDVRPHIWSASVAVAPLWLARGTQNKVLEAIAGGLHCVVTPAVLEGLPAPARGACTVAGDPKSFADAIARRLRDPHSEQERAHVRNAVVSLGWGSQLAPFLELVERARRMSVTSPGQI